MCFVWQSWTHECFANQYWKWTSLWNGMELASKTTIKVASPEKGCITKATPSCSYPHFWSTTSINFRHIHLLANIFTAHTQMLSPPQNYVLCNHDALRGFETCSILDDHPLNNSDYLPVCCKINVSHVRVPPKKEFPSSRLDWKNAQSEGICTLYSLETNNIVRPLPKKKIFLNRWPRQWYLVRGWRCQDVCNKTHFSQKQEAYRLQKGPWSNAVASMLEEQVCVPSLEDCWQTPQWHSIWWEKKIQERHTTSFEWRESSYSERRKRIQKRD